METSKGQFSFLRRPAPSWRAQQNTTAARASDLHRAIVFLSSAQKGDSIPDGGRSSRLSTDGDKLFGFCLSIRTQAGSDPGDQSRTEVKRVLLGGVGAAHGGHAARRHPGRPLTLERSSAAAHRCRNLLFCVLLKLLASCPSDPAVEPQVLAPIALHCL